MKKILLIADSNMSLSGVPVVFMSIVRLLSKEYQFDIVVFKDNDMYFEKEFLSYGGKVFRYNFNKPNDFLKKLIWIKFSYYKSVKKFIKGNIKLDEYTAIHSFQEDFSYPFIKEAKKAGIKNRIIHICSATSAYKLKKHLNRKLLDRYSKKAIRQASNIAFVSQKSLQLNDYKNRGVVVYNIYDEQKFGQITECVHKNIELTQIGTFSNRKNQLFSLEVINCIKEEIPNVHLNIVGKEIDDGYLEKMNSYIKDNKLESTVSILGTSTDRIELNKRTSYILYPSTMESFGLILIESQASGIHCFANKDIPNDADMGNADFLELNPELWSKSIIDYYSKHKNERKNPSNVDKFSKENFINTIKKLYS